MNPILTAGYSGHTVAELHEAVLAMNAVVLDIRMSPRSRMPDWNMDNLFRVLGPHNYRHLPDWGNLNYGGRGDIKLQNPPLGLVQVVRWVRQQPVILLCGCREYSECHRRVCAQLLKEYSAPWCPQGLDVQELVWPVVAAPTGKMKAISLWQPWAWLCVATDEHGRAEKENETRSWPTSYRGPLLIHAAKKCDDENMEFVEEDAFIEAANRHG